MKTKTWKELGEMWTIKNYSKSVKVFTGIMPESCSVSHIAINLTLRLFLLTQIQNTKYEKLQMRSEYQWHFKANKTGAYLKTKYTKKSKKRAGAHTHTHKTKAECHINKHRKK